MQLGQIVICDEEGNLTTGSVVIEDGATTWIRIGNHYDKSEM